MYHGQMMLQSGRDWWRSGWLGPRWYQYYPIWISGFDSVDFDNWVLHAKEDPTQWYRNTTDYLYGDSSAVIGAGLFTLWTYRYRVMRAQHGQNLGQYIVELWLKTGVASNAPFEREYCFNLGLGTTTYFIPIPIIDVWALGSWNESWTHYRTTFYQDSVTLHRMMKVERWDGTSWVFVRSVDTGAVGDWSGMPWIFLDCRTLTGGQITCGVDQLEMYAKYM